MNLFYPFPLHPEVTTSIEKWTIRKTGVFKEAATEYRSGSPGSVSGISIVHNFGFFKVLYVNISFYILEGSNYIRPITAVMTIFYVYNCFRDCCVCRRYLFIHPSVLFRFFFLTKVLTMEELK